MLSLADTVYRGYGRVGNTGCYGVSMQGVCIHDYRLALAESNDAIPAILQ